MGQFGNNVQIAINGLFLQMYKRLFKEFFLQKNSGRGRNENIILPRPEMILSETPYAIEDQSHGTVSQTRKPGLKP